MALDVYLTNACNLRCKYCFKHDEDSTPQISLRDVCEILEAAFQKGHRYVSITGGEPFIYKRIFDVIDFAHDRGFWIQILSHGGLLTKDRIELLRRFWRLRIRVSIDGSDRATHDALRGEGTFDATMAKITDLVQGGVNVGVGTTVSEHNVAQIPNLVDMCVQRGVAFLRMTPVARVRKGKSAHVDASLHQRILRYVISETIRHKHFIDLPNFVADSSLADIDILTTRRCMAGSRFFGITSDKKLLPCPLIYDHPDIPTAKFESGNSFDEITSRMDDLFGRIKTQLKGICGKCAFREVCFGGCLSEKLSFDLDLVDEQPVCTKKILEELRCEFDDREFQMVVQSWIAKLRQSIEADDIHACMRQAPYWSMNFKTRDRWVESNVRFN